MKPQSGDAVLVRHRVTTTEGEEVESSFDKKYPFRFTLDTGRVILGMNDAVKNLEVGESAKVLIPAAHAHGNYDESKHKYVRKTKYFEDITVGQKRTFAGDIGQMIEARVIRIEDDMIIFDTNHPLAGKDLILEIELIEILEEKTQEPFI